MPTARRQHGIFASSPDDMGELYRTHLRDSDRCKARVKLSDADVAAMVDEFVTSGRAVTLCPPAYAATTQQLGL
jgi:hypothetical protein